MFACGTGSMRGPRRAKTPLLLLLLLLTGLTGTVLCQDYGDDTGTEIPEEEVDVADDATPEPPVEIDPTVPDVSSAPDPSSTGVDIEIPFEEDYGSGQSHSVPVDAEGPTVDPTGTGPTVEPEPLNPIIILIPVVLVVVIIAMIVCGIFICRRWKKKDGDRELRKEDPYLDGSSTEKVPMPMFEEDVPSVLELEMEELGEWMKKDDEPADDSNHA